MNNLRKIITGVVLVILIATCVVTIPQAMAAGNDAGQDAALFVAREYAKANGVTVDEAFHRFEIRKSFSGLELQLIQNEADTYAGLWWEHIPQYHLTIAFTQNGKATIEKYLPAHLLDYVTIKTAERTLAQLQNTQNKISSAILSAGINRASDCDIKEGRVKIYVASDDRIEVDNMIQDGRLKVPDYADVITVKDMTSSAETDIYGGLQIQNVYSQNGTIGFAVEKSDYPYTKGVVTAGHLPDYLYHPTYSGGTALNFEAEDRGGSRDCQWHTCPGFTPTNIIKWSIYGYTWEITATRSYYDQNIGDFVSKFGTTTGYTAGYISSKTYMPESDGAIYNGDFILVDNSHPNYPNLSEPGDSGAPWFDLPDHCALGIHHGYSKYDDNDACYMPIDRIEGHYPRLGIRVLTSSDQ